MTLLASSGAALGLPCVQIADCEACGTAATTQGGPAALVSLRTHSIASLVESGGTPDVNTGSRL